MMKQRHKATNILEKIEVYFEDILIAIFSILAIIVLVGVLYLMANAESFTTAILGLQKVNVSFPFILMLSGYILLPWMVILGIMIIARDLWLIRKLMENVIKLEIKLTEEIETGKRKAKKSK